jgi:D-cysteine desulfhydrase
MTVATRPRVALATLPTPLTPTPRLSEELGVEVWCKRDDLTGFGLGGNKVRALEFLIGAARDDRADVLVTGGGPQSNWVMLAALAAVTAGMGAHVVMYGQPVPPSGNLLLLASLQGVEITFTGDPDRATVDDGIARITDRLRSAGCRPYAVGRGGAGAVGALGYVVATDELDRQLEREGLHASSVWLATGSCGTQAGLVAGHALAGTAREVVGVSVSRPVDECRSRITALSAGALELLGVAPVHTARWRVSGDQLGSYGVASPAGLGAAALVASTEGIFLDPVFGAKAMAGLVAAAGRGEVEGPVVFLVSGGAPTLFAARTRP